MGLNKVVINRFYPRLEFIYRHYAFCIIAVLTTWDYVINCISKITVNSIQPIVFIFPTLIFSFRYLTWIYSTIITTLRRSIFYILFTQIPIYFSFLRIRYHSHIEIVKRCFSKRHTFSTRLGMSISKFSSLDIRRIPTRTFTQPINFILFVFFILIENMPIPIYLSRLINYFVTSTRLCSSAKILCKDYIGISTITYTFISWMRTISIPSTTYFLNNNQLTKTLSNLIYVNSSWHIITLKGAPHMEIGIDVQAIRPIGERVKRKIPNTNCLNKNIITQMVAI